MDRLGLRQPKWYRGFKPNLSSALRPTGLIVLFFAVQIGLENAYEFVTKEELFNLHVSITAGILDNILPAFIIFWVCLKYIKAPFLTIVAMIWFTIETLDGLARVILLYAMYFATDVEYSYYLNQDYLIPLYWAYIAIPLIWLGWVRKNFHKRPTSPYTPLNTYLFFRRPKSVQDMLISLTGAPTSHVAVVHKGQHYFFKRGLDGYQKRSVRHKILKEGRLVKITPPPDFGKFLDLKVGSKYSMLSNNCVSVLRGTGLDIRKYDVLPSFLMMRYLDAK